MIGARRLAAALALILSAAPVLAQGLDFASGGRNGASPLEIYADQGLELSQDSRTVIARDNARAIRGNVTLTADVIVAHYRERSEAPAGSASRQAKGGQKAPQPAQPAGAADNSGSEVWRVEALGHVVISTPTQTVTGEKGDYNIDQAVVVLTGNNLKLVTPADTVTARDSMEYWETRQQAVARGNALAIRGENKVRGDILVADFAQGRDGKTAIQRMHAYDNVVLTTPREVVTGDQAEHQVETGIVTVTGSVKMTRGDNQLNGGYAIVNLNTGISRLLPNAPGSAPQRVRGLFTPQSSSGEAAPAGRP